MADKAEQGAEHVAEVERLGALMRDQIKAIEALVIGRTTFDRQAQANFKIDKVYIRESGSVENPVRVWVSGPFFRKDGSLHARNRGSRILKNGG